MTYRSDHDRVLPPQGAFLLNSHFTLKDAEQRSMSGHRSLIKRPEGAKIPDLVYVATHRCMSSINVSKNH